MIFVVVYAVVTLLCAWPARTFLVREVEQEDPDDLDFVARIGSACVGVFLAGLWPLALVLFVIAFLSKQIWRVIACRRRGAA